MKTNHIQASSTIVHEKNQFKMPFVLYNRMSELPMSSLGLLQSAK